MRKVLFLNGQSPLVANIFCEKKALAGFDVFWRPHHLISDSKNRPDQGCRVSGASFSSYRR